MCVCDACSALHAPESQFTLPPPVQNNVGLIELILLPECNMNRGSIPREFDVNHDSYLEKERSCRVSQTQQVKTMPIFGRR
jgi:hypothetical protein